MQYNAHTDRVLDIKMLNPAYLASISEDFTFRVWNYTTGQLITTYSKISSKMYSIIFLQDGRFSITFNDYTVIK